MFSKPCALNAGNKRVGQMKEVCTTAQSRYTLEAGLDGQHGFGWTLVPCCFRSGKGS